MPNDKLDITLIINMKDNYFDYIIVEDVNHQNLRELSKQVDRKLNELKREKFWTVNRIEFMKYIPTFLI